MNRELNTPTLRSHPNRSALLLALTLLVAALPANAQNPPAAVSQWESSAAAGLTLTRGNSSTVLANLSAQTARKWTQDELAFDSSLTYGESSGVENANSFQASGQYDRLLAERLYGGLKVNGVHDELADLAYRLSLSPLAGYYLIKSPATRLTLEIGPSAVFERLGGIQSTYTGLRIGERFEHKLNDRTKLWQSADFSPQVDRFSKYVVNIEAGIDTAITQKLSLRTVLHDTYHSIPAVGRKKNDVRLVSGIAYKF